MRGHLLNKAFWVLLLAGMYPIPCQAQCYQKGIAVLINSGSTSVAHVGIIAMGAQPTVTDNAGQFSFFFPRGQPGDPIVGIDVRKSGMEIVNIKEVREWVVSDQIIYKIVLCKQGYLDESRKKYYNLGKDYYQEKYNRNIQRLKKLKHKYILQEENFQKELMDLNLKLERQMEKLEKFADKFARINLDDLNVLDQKAMELVQDGKIDAAILLYENAKIMEEFQSKLARFDTLNSDIIVLKARIIQQLKWYFQMGDTNSILKAERLLDTLHKQDSLYNYDSLKSIK